MNKYRKLKKIFCKIKYIPLPLQLYNMIRKRVLEIIALQGAFREIKENLKEIAALEKLLKTPELVKDSEGNTMGKINSLIAETVELMAGIEQQCKVYSYHFGIEFNLIKAKLHKICGRQKLLKK